MQYILWPFNGIHKVIVRFWIKSSGQKGKLFFKKEKKAKSSNSRKYRKKGERKKKIIADVFWQACTIFNVNSSYSWNHLTFYDHLLNPKKSRSWWEKCKLPGFYVVNYNHSTKHNKKFVTVLVFSNKNVANVLSLLWCDEIATSLLYV